MKQGAAALVTGGARGIGRAIAARLVEDRFAVAIMDVDDEAGAETARVLDTYGTAHFIHADVSRQADVEAAAQVCRDRFGRLDALINNAGVMISTPLAEVALEDWERVLRVNLTGAFLCAKHTAPMLRACRGAIVNIASTRALMSEPDTEAYAASKGGLVALTHALAISLGPDVRVNCISPGWIDASSLEVGDVHGGLSQGDHRQHPAGRVGRPEDVAKLTAFLVGPRGGFVTGANFVIDGGMTRKMIYE